MVVALKMVLISTSPGSLCASWDGVKNTGSSVAGRRSSLVYPGQCYRCPAFLLWIVIGGGRGGVGEERSPAASLPHHEDHTAVRFTAHSALQHACWQVKLFSCLAGVEAGNV